MIIIDARKEKFLNINIKSVIEEIVEHSPSNLFRKLNKIIIIDSDYKKRAIGRHYHNKDGSYEIELMMDTFDDLSPEVLNEKEVLTYQIGRTLFHELYHHQTRINHKKSVKKLRDEKLADEFGKKMVKEILSKVYSKEELKNFRERILKLKEIYT